jgi:Ni,Fe-hydrogenase III large subunit/NADH:ubiquinone oxidoreductase subunit C
MEQRAYIELRNNDRSVGLGDIPVVAYPQFYEQVLAMLKDEAQHCVAYYAMEQGAVLRFFICIADDAKHSISIFSHEMKADVRSLPSLTAKCPQMHIYERELHEKLGVHFEGHPWLKPVRFPHDRAKQGATMDTYPFYSIDSEELHEVGVGPIHAGVIEPGHFRFICNGEKVLHLEIQLGYQHRGVEKAFTESSSVLHACVLSENIAGDTAVGHALAHAQLMESLAGIEVCEALQIERCIALELERIAVHIGDTAALCADVAYQLGQVVCEALRTTIINTTQLWCGNRFGKGLIRVGGSHYPLSDAVVEEMLRILDDTGKRFAKMTDVIYSLPSVLARFDEIGVVTTQQALDIGATGMAARTCNVAKDIRNTHPFQYFKKMEPQMVVLETGDVLARAMLRDLEVKGSIEVIRTLVEAWRKADKNIPKPLYDLKLQAGQFGVSMVEGWRGEICHTACTDNEGTIRHYKVKDPSLHNWMALALAVRNQEISDFPVCNKSFNLSYCGNDL